MADRARVSVATIRHIELHEHIGTLPSDEIDALRLAPEEAGVEFIDRGVRWRQGSPEEAEARYQAAMAIAKRSAALQAKLPLFSEDDLSI